MEGYGEAPCARRTAEREGVRHMAGCNRFDAKVVPIAVEIDRRCGLNTPKALICEGRRFEIARVGATLPCPSMFGQDGPRRDRRGRGRRRRYVVRGLSATTG